MKHLIFLSAIVLGLAGAQVTLARGVIRYHRFYILSESPAKACRLQLKITAKPRMQADILINGHRYTGVLTQNRENDVPTYNCYITIKSKKKLLMLRFSKEDDCYKGEHHQSGIPEHLQALSRMKKYMMLESCRIGLTHNSTSATIPEIRRGHAVGSSASRARAEAYCRGHAIHT